MQTTKKDDALLEACVEHDTPETEAALAEARLRFRKAVEAEFGATADRQPQKDFGRPDVTLVRPIEDDNRAHNVGRRCVTCNYVVGAIRCDGDHANFLR
jgi:hypothetical protein